MQVFSYNSLELKGFQEAAKLLANYRFGAEAWPGLEPEQAARDALAGLGDQAPAWVLVDSGAWQWLATLADLPFDSELMGRKMAKLQLLAHREPWPGPDTLRQGRELLKAVVAHCAETGLEFVTARVPSRDILAAQALESHGFRLMDASVEWMLGLESLPGKKALPPGLAIRAWHQDEVGRLEELAANTMCDLGSWADRFAMDPRLRPGCPELYRRWMKNSLTGDQADQVLVLEQDGEAEGFLTLRLPPGGKGPGGDCGWVVINALNPGLRGRGLYNELLLRGLAWLKKHGARNARVRTKLSQQAVIRAWSRLGARQVHSDFTFHLWLDQLED